MAYDGTLKFDTKVDQGGFDKGIATLKSTALSAISAIGAAFATGAIVQGLVTVGKESIKLASDLQEVQNVVDVTFGSGASRVNEFAQSAVTAFGLSELAAKQYAGTLGAMLKSSGLATDAALDMSLALTGLAGDFASFYNVTSEEALMKIRAGLAGEVEPLRQWGISMTIANLEAYALSQGIDKVYSSMTQAEQVALRYNYLMSVSADAQGDFARTSDSYANSQRLAALAVDELKTAIGNRLLPIAAKMQQQFASLANDMTKAFDARGLSGMIDVISDRFPIASAAVTGLVAALTALLVIRTVQKAMQAFIVVQKSLTALEIAGTVAEWAEIGALTAKQIVVGLLTGKLGLATAAQALFNAVIAANPVMLIVTAIGLLVGGVVLLTKHFDELNPEIADTREELKALDKQLDESKETYSDATDEIEKQKFSLDGIVEKLEQASKAYQGSSIEQAKMQAMCDTLSSSVDGLSITFDTQTGALSMNVEQIYKAIDAQYALARASAASARYQELVTAQLDAQYEAYKAKIEYDKYFGEGALSTPIMDRGFDYQVQKDNARRNYEKALRLQGETAADVSAFSDFAGVPGVIGDTTTSLNSLKEAERGVKEETQGAIIAGYEFSDKVLTQIGMTADEVSARLDSFASAATNMFEKINTESELSVADMISNLEANAIAIEDWGDNIAYLGGKLPSDLLQPLVDEGPEKMAGVLNNLAGASEADLAALSEAFANGGEEAKEAWLLSLGAGLETQDNPLTGMLDIAVESATEKGAEIGKILVDSIRAQDYSGAATSLTTALQASITVIGSSFADLLERLHYNLAYALGGVAIDVAAMSYSVRSSLAAIPTTITIHVNVVYSTSGTLPGIGAATLGNTPNIKPTPTGSGSTGGGIGNVNINIGGEVPSVNSAIRESTQKLQEVLYGRA